jgi:hypothetical protein
MEIILVEPSAWRMIALVPESTSPPSAVADALLLPIRLPRREGRHLRRPRAAGAADEQVS